MSYQNIVVDEHEARGIWVIQIARPKVLNALSAATLSEVEDVVGRLQDAENIGAAVITGGACEKRPAFAAGADIAEMLTFDAMELRQHGYAGQRCLNAIEDSSKPILAAINGFALGGGLELAMACHVRYATQAAQMGQPEINLGIIPGFGGSQRLPRLVGKGVALDMLLRGYSIDGERALAIGLVDFLFEPSELLEQCCQAAEDMAQKAPIARELILNAVQRGLDAPLKEALNLEADLFGLVGSTQDVKEGLGAFTEKRKASFKGK